MLRRSLVAPFFSFASSMRDKLEADKAAEAEAFNTRREQQRTLSEADVLKKSIHDDESLASRCPRSSLFVPCSNRKALSKIPTLNADVFILDLEDSVPIASKTEARDNLVDFVTKGTEDGSLADKRLIVRVNSPTFSKDTMKFGVKDMDAVALLGDRIEGVGIPKTSTRDADILRDIIHPNHSVWAFIETPQAVIEVNQILQSRFYKVAAMGLNDLSMELQLPLDYHMSTGKNNKASAASPDKVVMSRRLPLYFAMMSVINAARAYDVQPLDGVYNDPTDTLGFVAEANEGKRLGFSGKTLIHPNQVDAIHKVYAPSEGEIEWAKRVLTALHASNGGVAVVDGKMVEELHGRMAKRILAYVDSAAGSP